MSLEELISEAGARADSVPSFVMELLHSLDARIAKLEGSKEPEKPADAEKPTN